MTAELARRASQARVLGVDLSPEMVDYARRNYATDRLSFARGDAADLRPEGRFDLITSFACLHWLEDPAAAVARMVQRSLAPGGLLRVQMGGEGNMATFVDRVERLRREPRWQSSFQGFEFPWSFWPLEPYRRALAGLHVERLELIRRTGTLATRQEFRHWFTAGWRPYVDRLPGAQLDRFLDELLAGHEGPVVLPMVRVDLTVRL